MDKMKRSGFFRGMLDNWRHSSSSLTSQASSTHHSFKDDSKSVFKNDLDDLDESLKSEHFMLNEFVRHGFPFNPTCVAYDPIQRLIAIGTRSGCLRILGRPGVDINLKHVGHFAIIQLIFLINDGNLISICADDSLHLWNIKSNHPFIIHSLKFQRERITFAHLPFQSKWLYIGTERGNVHVANVDNFQLSGYIINWNKAIELSRKTHPGSVIHLSDCPADSNKLLIGYETGTIILWDLKNKNAEIRINYNESILSISWHHEGRQFLCSHLDGSITTWNIKNSKPLSVVLPHSKNVNEDLKSEPCRPIFKVEWRTVKDADSYIIFSGGLPHKFSETESEEKSESEKSAQVAASVAAKESQETKVLSKPDLLLSTQSLTVIHGKATTVLEMEHNIIDFITLCESPWLDDFNEPYAILVLLHNDLVVVDLTSPGYPCFQNPHTMDLHESPVTCCAYFADCPTDVIPAFYSVGYKNNMKRSGFSEKEWPINGGEWGTATLSYPEFIITGHADGSLKFWDASLETSFLDFLEDVFAIEQIAFCSESRILCVAGASSHVIVFKFNKNEASSEIPFIQVIMNYNSNELDENDFDKKSETTQGIGGLLRTQSSNEETFGTNHLFYLVSVKSGQHKRPPGFQPELVCLSPWIDESVPPYKITSLAVNSSYNLIAYGNENGLVIIDLIQKSLVLNVGTAELYGTSDPYQRYIKSPKKTSASVAKDRGDNNQSDTERSRSPTSSDQLPQLLDEEKHDKFENSSTSKCNLQPIDEDTSIKLEEPVFEVKEEMNPENYNELVENESLLQSEKNDPRIQFNTKNDSLPLDEAPLSSMASKKLPLRSCVSDSEFKIGNKHKALDSKVLTIDCLQDPLLLPNTEVIKRQFRRFSEKKKNRIIDLRDNKEISAMAKISSKHVCKSPTLKMFQNQQLTLANPPVKKQNTLEMKRSRLQYSRILQKMQSLTSMDDSTFDVVNLNIDSGSDKIDNLFSRSRSSSISSLENVTNESIPFLIFSESFTTKSDSSYGPCLWVGTSLGSAVIVTITLPETNDNRVLCLQSVLAISSGNIFRLKGSILCISFLEFFNYSAASFSEFKESKNSSNLSETKEKKSGGFSRSSSSGQSIFSINRIKLSSASSLSEFRDSQLIVIASEKQARVISLPTQICVAKANLSETSFAVTADVIQIKNTDVINNVCLVAYLATGNIIVYSLPNLRPLVDIDFLPLIDVRIAKTLTFSTNGHGIYFASPFEIQKFSINAAFKDIISDMIGSLYVNKDMPEQPKQGFFKGLFSAGSSGLDREELFGEASGKGSKVVAKHIPGSQSSLEFASSKAGTLAGEVSKTRMALSERGEHLEKLEDRTVRMMDESESFRNISSQLLNKYKDKKWYQF